MLILQAGRSVLLVNLQLASESELNRTTGAAAFTGLGAYIYISGRSQLLEQQHKLAKKAGTMGGLRARMAGTGLLASTFVGMGLYRLVN